MGCMFDDLAHRRRPEAPPLLGDGLEGLDVRGAQQQRQVRDHEPHLPRCSRDAAEMQSRCRVRCSRGADEVQVRCSRDAAEVHPRCNRDAE